MPGSTGPNLGLVWGYSPHEDGWGVNGYNPGFARLDTLVHLTVLGVLNTPPGSPVNGERYIVGSAPTGAFVSHEDEIAVYLTIGTPDWLFLVPKLGWRAWDDDTGTYKRFNGSAWVADTGIADIADAGDVDIASPSENDVLVYDGALWVNQRPHYAIGFSAPQTTAYSASQVIGHHVFMCGVTIPANFGAYLGRSTHAGGTTNATASTQFSIQKTAAATPNSFSQVGTVTFAPGGVVDTLATSGGTEVTFADGDVMRIVAPVSPDATFAGFYMTISGFVT